MNTQRFKVKNIYQKFTYPVHVAYLIVLTILSVPVWALNVDLAWSLSLDNVYNGSETKQVLLTAVKA